MTSGRPGTINAGTGCSKAVVRIGTLQEGGELSAFVARRSRFKLGWIRASSLALVMLLAACGESGKVATVDGTTIGFDEVAALIPSEGDTIDTELFARSLMLVISYHVLAAEAREQFGLQFTEAEIDTKVEELVLQSGFTEEEVLADYNLTKASLRSIGAQQLLADEVVEQLVSLQSDPTEEELRLQYEGSLPGLTQVCAAHILLESREEADEVLERARSGEDFAELAMELSVGPSGPNGGDLGCASPANYVAEFADATLTAEPGVPYGPVETQFGWHVIMVAERIAPGFDELKEQLAEDLKAGAGEQLWIDWLTASLVAADVQVEPEYGTWTTTPVPNVIPPGG